jgi:proteasome accessory factor C
MPETAPAQVARIVHLVASMSRRDKRQPLAYRAAARQLGVSVKAIRQDLDALVRLSDEYKSWLSSLSVAFTADGFALASQGHFRRPFRLTADETLALVVGLAGGRGGQQMAAKLGRALVKSPVVDRAPTSVGLGPSPSVHVEDVLALAREARDEHRRMELLYCGANSEQSRRVVDPYQIVQRQRWWYVIAWCEDAAAYRHFRADRVLGATLLDGQFAPRTDFAPIARPEEVFRTDATIPATVAFSTAIARWLKEKYPNGQKQSDGRYVVTFRVADPAWFVREVLQYGAEAEVLEPKSLREAVRGAVG